MTVKEFIQQTFGDFGVQTSEAFLLSVCLKNSLLPDTTINTDTYNPVSIAIVKEIPSILLHPTSVGESGFSISRAQREDIIAFYSLKCDELGLEDHLSPRVTFL